MTAFCVETPELTPEGTTSMQARNSAMSNTDGARFVLPPCASIRMVGYKRLAGRNACEDCIPTLERCIHPRDGDFGLSSRLDLNHQSPPSQGIA